VRRGYNIELLRRAPERRLKSQSSEEGTLIKNFQRKTSISGVSGGGRRETIEEANPSMSRREGTQGKGDALEGML